MTGSTLAHYRLLDKIGEGGMGVVYRAEDTRLARFVALKLLRGDFSSDERHRARFLREARAVAALDHPNICTIYEIGEADGRMFLAMSYVDGPSLSRLLRGGLPSVQQTAGIILESADGLAEAHRKGIVHRDIKPGNLLLTSRATVKIVDFGLATLFGAASEMRITQEGLAVGTPAYMAPEQWLGRDADPRADLWALGVVLYQCLTGTMPFSGVENRTLGHAILHEAPPRLTELRPELAPEWDLLIERMLAKNPADRIRSAGAVVEAIRPFLQGGLLRTTETPTQTTVVLSAPPRAEESPSIAVLPFSNIGSNPEHEYFSDGITEELITGLAKIGSLRVVSRTSAFRLKGSTDDPRQIGEQLRVKYLLTGSVRMAGPRVRITAELVGTGDGYQIWSEVYQGDASDVFAIQEELAQRILDTLKIKLSMSTEPRKRYENFEAYQLYLKGLFHWNKRTAPAMERAIAFFQQAIDCDPNYAQAYCGLADSLMLSSLFAWSAPKDTMPRANQAARRALELDPAHAEAHVSLAMIHLLYDWEPSAAAREFRTGLDLNPGYAIGRAFHAHFLLWTGRYDAAMREIKDALDLDPLSLNMITNAGWFLCYQQRPEEATEWLRKALDLDADYVRANLYLGVASAMLGRSAQAVAASQRAVEASPDDPILRLWLARVYALAGNRQAARAILAEIEPLAGQRYISPLDVAIVYGALDEIPRAMKFLEKAVEERCAIPIYLRDPRFAPFRDDSRFLELIERTGISAISTRS